MARRRRLSWRAPDGVEGRQSERASGVRRKGDASSAEGVYWHDCVDNDVVEGALSHQVVVGSLSIDSGTVTMNVHYRGASVAG